MLSHRLRSSLAASLKEFTGRHTILPVLILTLAASAAFGVTSLYASPEALRAEQTAKTDFRQLHSATHPVTAKKAIVDSVINDVAPVTVSAASYESPAVAPEALVAAFGTKLATTTVIASDADPATPGYQLPTTLGGTTVRVNGTLAGLLFVSPLQVNYVMPANTQTGTAIVQIVSGDGTISNGIVKVTQAAPSVFGGNADGRGVPAGYLVRVKADGAQSFEPIGQLNTVIGRLVTRPIDLGPAGERVFLVIFLSGIAHAGDTNNDNNLNESVHVIIGGTEIIPTYAGQQGIFAGLEQLNVELPRSLIGRGKVNFSVIASGHSSSNLNEVEFAGAPGIAPPQVAGFSASSVLAGQMMTINGAGFAAEAADNVVRISGAEARVAAAAANELSILVPFGAESGKVSVRTPQGESESSGALVLRTSISGFVEDTTRQPMRNVRVKVLGRDLEVTTNREGLFVLPDVPTGAALVEVDANPVTSPPFPKVTLKMAVSGNRDNQFARPISLQQATGPSLSIGGNATEPQLRTTPTRRKRATQAAAGGTIQTGGVTLEVPSGTATFPDGSNSGTITLTLLDNNRTPIDLPPGQFSSAIAQLTPFGVTLNPGGKLTFPNPQNFAPGTIATLFRFEQTAGSPDIGRFVEAGAARVSDDGQRIETEAGAISRTGIYFVSNLRQTTTVVGRVVDSDGITPVRNALARARGQEAFTDGNGAFILRNVAVSPGEQISVEASFQRTETRVDRKQSNSASVVIGGITFITPDIALPAPFVNRPPVIQAPATLTVSEGAITDIPVTVTDPDEDQTVSLALSGAGFAALIESAGTVLRLSPDFTSAGSYTLTLTATDNLNLTTTRNITLTVSNTNRAPSGTAQSLTLNEDNSQAITLTGSDPDGDTITFAIVAPPARGALTGAAPNLTYTPAANYTGPDSFTFKVSDGTVDSAPVTVNFTISSVNDAPTASAQTVTTAEDTARSITLAGSDIDGDTLSFTVVSAPTNGALSGTAPNLTYTPAANYNGADSFTFKVNDGTVDSATATVGINVTAVNDAPTASAQSVATNEDTARAITLSGSDVDGDSLTYSIVSGPANGALSGTAPNLTYTPAANYNGADSLTFRVSDGSLSSAPATVTLTITSVNDLPTITAGAAISVTQSQAVTAAASATVSDIETTAAALTVTAQTVPAGLTISNLSNTNGAITADIAAACNAAAGANTVVLRVTDAGGATATANLTVNVNAASLNITTQPSSQSALNGASATFSVAATGTGTLAYQWRRGGTNLNDGGNVSGATSATLTINPVSPGDAGSYEVVVTGACGSVTSNTVTLNALNNAPALRLSTLDFDGAADSTGDYVTVDDASALDLSDNFTIEAWIRPGISGTPGCCRTIISKPARDDGTQATGFRLDLSNDQPSFGIVDQGGPKTVTASTPVLPGVWTHLAAVKQGSTLKLYLNGLLVQSANTGSTSGARTDADLSQSTKLIIGREFLTGLLDRTFAGTISDVRLWNVVRTDTEILNNFDALLSGSETGLVLNLRLNEGSGAVANDRSGNGRQGTLGGGSTVNQPTWQAAESFTENDPPLTLFNNLTVSDQENANLTSATVRFTSGFISSEDALNFTNQGGIAGSFNSVSGTLTLSGSAAVSAYEAALRSISYSNSSENPNTTDRTIEVKVNDGQADSNPAVLTLSVIALNDAPTITTGAAISVTQSQSVTGTAIATVSDIETTAAALTVTAQTVPTGLTISNLSNTNGAITADIAAACNAVAGANIILLEVSDASGATATANLTVNVAAASLNISSHPAAQTVCETSSATFSVIASGTGTLSYQWRKNGANISGATGSSFNISSATTGDAGGYDVVITGACGTVTSNAATLTVNTTVGIGSQPAAQIVCPGSAAGFSVTASGTGPFTYQWRRNGTNISGATSSTFGIASALAGDAGNYDVVVTGVCGVATSNTAALTVNTSVGISAQPTAQTICETASATFSVTASGTGPFTYQWRKNGTSISGATSNTFTIISATTSDAGSYDVIVTGACGTVTSNPATVTINTITAITTHPVAQTVCPGSPTTFSVMATGAGLSYQWRKNGANISGATSSSFTIASTVPGDAGSYDVVVSGACGTATSNTATLIVNTTVGISNQPIAQTVCEGAAASFSVTPSGTGPFTYQWRKNSANISGATSSAFSIASTVAADAGSYDVIVTGACGTVTSNPATLAFHAAPSLGTYLTTSVAAGGNVTAIPGTAPTSSAAITSLTAVAPAGFTGTLAAGSATGVVTITNAAPAGSYNIVVKVINSCGLSSTRNFTLTVNDPTACATPGFAASASLSAGTQPRFITTGDFNGDGKQDFVVANFGSNNVTILLGNGSGGFTQSPGSPFAVGAGPVGVAVADYNGDGKQDLATANYTADNVTVLLGDGSGGFTEAAGSPFSAVTGIHPESIVAGDFNSDGKFDLAVANVFSDNVTILLGNGGGGFTQAPGSPISVGGGPYTLALGDFNSDGAQDIISANYISHTLTILSGNGSGGFSVTTGPTIGSGLTAYYYVAVGEFNSDGHQDLAITNHDSNDVTILLGNGSGGFLPAELSPVRVGAAPYSVVTGDFNGDGKQDLAVANLSSDNVTILIGDGAAGFSQAPGSPLSVGSSPYLVTVGDFNGDGKQEIATANFASNTISTRLAYCNQIPSITAGSALTLSQQQTSTGATIATVSDTETAAGNLTVTATAPAGITLSNIVNTGGTITADVATECAAFSGANTVVLRVTDEGGQSATANLTVNVNGDVVITTQPASQSAFIGAEISFTVSATGPGTLAYQWRKNGVNLTESPRVIGTTTATLTLSPVASGDDGDYDVVVTSACGSAISSAATLTIINEAPVLNVPRNLFGDTGSLISFTASATDTDVNQTLTFSATNLPTGANFDPATREFTWTPEFDQVGVFNVNITVTDNGVPILSDTKTVTITISPLLDWTQTSGPAGGPVFPLVIDGSSIFVGTPEGISRSNDDGATWSGGNGDLPLSPVTGFAKVGAARFALQYDSAGHYVYRSTNGVNWTNVSSGLPTTLPFTAIRANGTALFVATLGGGVYRSTDNGDTWTVVNNGLPNLNARSLAADGTYLYAGLDDAIAVSSDDGDNWAAVNTGLPLGAPPLAVRSFATSGAKIYAGTNKGVFESTLGGTSWTSANSGLFEVDIQTLTLDGTTLYAGIGNFNGVWRADTSGILAWTQDASGLDVPVINSIAITATKRLVSTPRGVFASAATQGGVWNFSGSGLIFTDVTAFTQIFPIKYAATNGNGVFRTSDNGGTWTAVNNGLNDPAVFSLATDGTILFAGTSAGVYSSSDNGANWTFFDNLSTLPFAGTVNGMVTLGADVFAGTQTGGVYRSDKTTAAWIQINNGLTNLSVRAMAKFGTKLYAGTENGLFRSTDNGDNWTLISGAGSGLTNQAIRAFTGFSGNIFVGTAGGVFYSTDDGDTWTAVNTGITNLNIQSLAYRLPNSGIHVFAGTDNGVFFSDDGINWKNASYGLRNRNVRALFFDSLIFGGTSGGVYTSPVPSDTPSAAEPGGR
jgi:hypothetical protein